jgi:hypothetical protein
MKTHLLTSFLIAAGALAETYPVVDTAQKHCYDNSQAITFPTLGKSFYGQDAQYRINPPSYTVNGDGTVTDNVTGLMWTQDPGEKMTWQQAIDGAKDCAAGGCGDWRLPTIKELYSLIDFNGTDPDPMGTDTSGLTPFIDASVFGFKYGDISKGERIIDSQWATSTLYESTTMGGSKTMFGVNFADGRIKGYPVESRRGKTKFYVLYVRGNEAYGRNEFVDNGDGTVTDKATGLMWMQADSGTGMNWSTALVYADLAEHAGCSDWRLPTAKELQSIVDYTRCPDATGSAAIDPVFQCTQITNEAGQKDYAQYWTSTTHVGSRGAEQAAYVAFGRALGYMRNQWMDVHGAGCQRSDPKTGDASQFPTGRGPQGDAIRIENMVRLVRGGPAVPVLQGPEIKAQSRDRAPAGPRSQAAGGAGFMDREDRNGDGRVTLSEFRGPSDLSDVDKAKIFDRLDKNGDGVITADEAPSGQPPNRK